MSYYFGIICTEGSEIGISSQHFPRKNLLSSQILQKSCSEKLLKDSCESTE